MHDLPDILPTAAPAIAAEAAPTHGAAPAHAIRWFEIPCTDLDRAQRFYERVLARPMRREDFGGGPMAVFHHDKPAAGGCLVTGPERHAAPDGGVRIYLDCGAGLEAVLARVGPAGGTVRDGCTDLPYGLGCIAHVQDTEGNLVGLHAPGR